MQRVGTDMRMAVYPANFFAELTAGAATAMYLARALLNVGDDVHVVSPIGVRFGRSRDRDVHCSHTREWPRRARACTGGVDGSRLVILLTLVGLQATSQLVDAMKPAIDGESRRFISDLEWFEWARIGFFCALLGVLHAAVLFGGRPRRTPLRMACSEPIAARPASACGCTTRPSVPPCEDFSKLVTAYNTHREADVARGFDPGPMPAFDAATRAMLTRMTQQTPAATAAVSPRATASTRTPTSPVAAQSVEPALPVDEGTADRTD